MQLAEVIYYDVWKQFLDYEAPDAIVLLQLLLHLVLLTTFVRI